MTESAVAFVDVETTGLDPERHEAWDIALIVDGAEHEWHVRPTALTQADPNALRINNFYDRTVRGEWKWTDARAVADMVAVYTAGRHLVGAVPSFDAAFLSRFLRANARREAWHYHLVDVEAIAAGRLGIAPPWDSEYLSLRLGVTPDTFERHTAIGDVRWVRALYQAAIPPLPTADQVLGILSDRSSVP